MQEPQVKRIGVIFVCVLQMMLVSFSERDDCLYSDEM